MIALYGSIVITIAAALVFYTAYGAPSIPDALRRLQHSQQQPSKSGRISFLPSNWAFNYARDGRNYGLSDAQCDAAFPELYKEVNRAVAYRRRVGLVTPDELDVGWRADGIVRAMIHDNQLYIVSASGFLDPNHRPRSLATLHSLHRAITAFQGTVPNIEFTLTDHDSALLVEDSNFTTWSYSRLPKQESLWLMPDFGFWGWPDVGLRSYAELQASLNANEDEFLDKIPKLVWRGATTVAAYDVRAGLLEHSAGQPWSDVQTLDWSNATNINERLISMEDHCGYMFVVQTEGNTYSGRLKYLLNCHSVVLSHELRWVEHFHHLLRHSGPDQNYVRLKRDFSDLPKTMANLLKPKSMQFAEDIASNARATFRTRYLTPAAGACYWRALIRGWASVQGFEPQLWVESEEPDWAKDWGKGTKVKRKMRGTPFESFAIMEEVEWEVPARPRRVCFQDES